MLDAHPWLVLVMMFVKCFEVCYGEDVHKICVNNRPITDKPVNDLGLGESEKL